MIEVQGDSTVTNEGIYVKSMKTTLLFPKQIKRIATNCKFSWSESFFAICFPSVPSGKWMACTKQIEPETTLSVEVLNLSWVPKLIKKGDTIAKVAVFSLPTCAVCQSLEK